MDSDELLAGSVILCFILLTIGTIGLFVWGFIKVINWLVMLG